MKNTLQILSMMSDDHTKKNMRLVCFAGSFFAIGAYCAADESNRINGLALISYFIFLIQLIQMNQGIIGKDSSGLELLYQSDRKKDILRYGIFVYNLFTMLVYLVFTWVSIFAFSFFKDVGMAYIPLSFAIVMTSIYTTLLLLLQAHGYEKACNIFGILYAICFVFVIILSFDIFPIRLQVPSFLMSLSTLPYVLMTMLAGVFVLWGIDYYLYGKNKGLRPRKKR